MRFEMNSSLEWDLESQLSTTIWEIHEKTGIPTANEKIFEDLVIMMVNRGGEDKKAIDSIYKDYNTSSCYYEYLQKKRMDGTVNVKFLQGIYSISTIFAL